jgi:hypothetical protein
LAGYLVKPLLSLQGTEWRERGYGLWIAGILADVAASLFRILDVFGGAMPILNLIQSCWVEDFAMHSLH